MATKSNQPTEEKSLISKFPSQNKVAAEATIHRKKKIHFMRLNHVMGKIYTYSIISCHINKEHNYFSQLSAFSEILH